MPAQPLPERLINYFEQLESKHGIKLTDEQKSWYYGKEKTLGADMKREYPSIFSEAFEHSIKGAYYADQFIKLYTKGAITESLPVNEHQPVSTYWDLGVGDSTSIWFIKKVGAGSCWSVEQEEEAGAPGEGLEQEAEQTQARDGGGPGGAETWHQDQGDDHDEGPQQEPCCQEE